LHVPRTFPSSCFLVVTSVALPGTKRTPSRNGIRRKNAQETKVCICRQTGDRLMRSSSLWGKTKKSLLGDQINPQSTTKRSWSRANHSIPAGQFGISLRLLLRLLPLLLVCLDCAAPPSFGVPTCATFLFLSSILALPFWR